MIRDYNDAVEATRMAERYNREALKRKYGDGFEKYVKAKEARRAQSRGR